MFCHLGLGKAYRRSYEFFLFNKITSSAARKGGFNGFSVYGFLGYPYRVLVELFRGFVVNSYRYGGREYYVFPEEFCDLFKLVARLINNLYRFYGKDVNMVFKHIENLLQKCDNVENCLSVLSEEVSRVERILVERSLRGRKALTTRFEKGFERCRSIVYRYFPGFINPHIHIYSSVNDLENFLGKLLGFERARRYSEFIAYHSPTLIASNDLVLVAREHELNGFRIFVDDCSETNSYAILKVVGASTANGYIQKVYWVAILGIDKYTKQLFLHYIPPTLLLRKAEICRMWLLGLVDDFGRWRYHSYKLVEV